MSDGRPRDRTRVQEVSYDDMETIRRREYEDMRKEWPRRDFTNIPPQSLVKATMRRHDEEDDYALVHRRRNSDHHRASTALVVDRRDRRPSRRRSSSSRESSEEDSDYKSQRRRAYARPRDTAKSMAGVEREIEEEVKGELKRTAVCVHKDDGYLWYSMKKRNEANFLEKHFDSSYDGLIAGVAGAAIGSITAARFGGEQHKTAKAVGGALLGALAFNAAESHWRVWTEVAEEAKEKRDEAKEGLKDVANKARRFVPQV